MPNIQNILPILPAQTALFTIVPLFTSHIFIFKITTKRTASALFSLNFSQKKQTLVLKVYRKLKAYWPSYLFCYSLGWDLSPPEVSIFDFWENRISPSAFMSQEYTTEVTNTLSPEVSQSWLNWLGGNKTRLKHNLPPSGNCYSLPWGSLTTKFLKETRTSFFFFAFNLT